MGLKQLLADEVAGDVYFRPNNAPKRDARCRYSVWGEVFDSSGVKCAIDRHSLLCDARY